MCSIKMSLRVQRVHVWEDMIVIYNDVWIRALRSSQAHTPPTEKRADTTRAFELASKEHKNSSAYLYWHMRVVQTFTYMQYICCWVKRLIQMTFCLLSLSLTWITSIMKAVVWLYDGLQAASGYRVNTASVYMLFYCLLACSLFIFNSSTMRRLCSLESVWMVFEF